MLTIYNISRLVTMEPGPGREGALGVIPRGAVVLDGDRISWVGPESELTGEISPATSIDANNGVVMPGLIDCHTHLVHAGWRADEFVRRARGATYQEIAVAGGGIMSTVRATRETSEEDLVTAATARASEAMSRGVTTLEIKSGYGLDLETELKTLRVARSLREQVAINYVTTFLAHVVPAEWKDNRAHYVKLVCEEIIPAIAAESLAQMCDIFVEEGAFTPDEARVIAAAARKAGMQLRLHVDQFTDVGGGALAAELGALSADHLDVVSEAGIAAMASAGVVAVLLPGATMFAGRGMMPPVGKLVDAGVPIAIATDYNPGTSPTLDLFLCGTIAIAQMGLDPDLALLGMTRNASRALGRNNETGSIAVGKSADLVILGCENEYFPLYRFGSSCVRAVICRGEVLTE